MQPPGSLLRSGIWLSLGHRFALLIRQHAAQQKSPAE
jgi:hypothetical protein